jgi:hypothetical protein
VACTHRGGLPRRRLRNMGPSAGEAPRKPGTPFWEGWTSNGALPPRRSRRERPCRPRTIEGPGLSSRAHGDFEAGQPPAGSVGPGCAVAPCPRSTSVQCSCAGTRVRVPLRSHCRTGAARRCRWPRRRAPRRQPAHVMTTGRCPGTAVHRSRQTGFGYARIGPRPRTSSSPAWSNAAAEIAKWACADWFLERLPAGRARPAEDGRTSTTAASEGGVAAGGAARPGVIVGSHDARGAGSRARDARGTRASARTVGTPRPHGRWRPTGMARSALAEKAPHLLVRLARDLRW